jgi:hypothetical protein
MFDGSPEFTLKYQPPSERVATHGVKMTAPFQLMFTQMDFQPLTTGASGLAGPHVGYTNYEFRKPDGARLGTGAMKLECGKGTVLSARYSAEPPGNHIKVPTTFHLPYLGKFEQDCLRELRSNGRFKFTVAERDFNQPAVVIEDRMRLQWAISKVHKLWRGELKKAKQGRCKLSPPPPPPF